MWPIEWILRSSFNQFPENLKGTESAAQRLLKSDLPIEHSNTQSANSFVPRWSFYETPTTDQISNMPINEQPQDWTEHKDEEKQEPDQEEHKDHSTNQPPNQATNQSSKTNSLPPFLNHVHASSKASVRVWLGSERSQSRDLLLSSMIELSSLQARNREAHSKMSTIFDRTIYRSLGAHMHLNQPIVLLTSCPQAIALDNLIPLLPSRSAHETDQLLQSIAVKAFKNLDELHSFLLMMSSVNQSSDECPPRLILIDELALPVLDAASIAAVEPRAALFNATINLVSQTVNSINQYVVSRPGLGLTTCSATVHISVNKNTKSGQMMTPRSIWLPNMTVMSQSCMRMGVELCISRGAPDGWNELFMTQANENRRYHISHLGVVKEALDDASNSFAIAREGDVVSVAANVSVPSRGNRPYDRCIDMYS